MERTYTVAFALVDMTAGYPEVKLTVFHGVTDIWRAFISWDEADQFICQLKCTDNTAAWIQSINDVLAEEDLDAFNEFLDDYAGGSTVALYASPEALR